MPSRSVTPSVTDRRAPSLLSLINAVGLLSGFGLPAVNFAAESEDPSGKQEEVLVVGEKYRAAGLKDQSATGSRLDLTSLETPASIEVLTGEIVRSRGDTSLVEAASRATGVTQTSAANGGSFAARGFSGNNSVMRLYDGTRMYVTGGSVSFPFDTWSVDRIEVLRGAASVLYGEGAIGAAINVIPKKPTHGPIANDVRLVSGSDSTRRAAVGSGGGIGEQWSYRLDASNNQSDGYVDQGQSDNLALAGAVRFDATPTLSLTLSHDYGKQRPSTYYGVPLNAPLSKATRRTNYNVIDAETKFIENWSRLNTLWQASDEVSVRNQTYYLQTHRRWRNDVRNYSFNASAGTVERGGSQNLYYEMGQIGNRLDAVIRSKVFGLDNALTLGTDLNRMNYYRSRAYNGAASVVSAVDYYPSAFPAVVASNSERFKVRTDTYSVFFEDRLQFTERFSVIGGFRWDHINVDRESLTDATGTFDKTFTQPSGRVGMVFEMTPALSFYAQYSTAVDPLSDVVNTTALQSHFDMATGKQIEAGVKQLFNGGRGEWTLAAYSIVKNNLLVRSTAAGNVSAPESWDQVGEQSSRGVEASFAYSFTDAIRVDLNAAMLEARYEDFQELVSGVLVSRDGKTPTDVPEQAANLWLTWQVSSQWQALAGMRYVGSRYTNTTNTSELGSYTATDASVHWQLRPDTRISIQGFNVFDRLYAQSVWSGQAVLGRPRSLEVSASLSF